MTGMVKVMVPCELEIEFTREETAEGETLTVHGAYLPGRTERMNVWEALTDVERKDVLAQCRDEIDHADSTDEALADEEEGYDPNEIDPE